MILTKISQSKEMVKARLAKCEEINEHYFVSYFETVEIAKNIKPGQFVMVDSGQYLLRPFSVFEVKENEISILYKVIGPGTKYLSKLKSGSEVILNGPLGKGFKYPLDKNKKILIVAGGIGIATFPFTARVAFENGYKVKTIFGARTKSDLVCVELLEKYGEVSLISDDGSSGKKGFVTELLLEELNQNKNQEVMICGPTPMLKSTIELCNKFNISAQVSFEEFMACGFGICMSCVVKSNGKYIRTCTEGPVIYSNQVSI